MILIILRLIVLMAAYGVAYIKKKWENISIVNRNFTICFKKVSIIFTSCITFFFDFLFNWGPVIFLSFFFFLLLLIFWIAFFSISNLNIITSLILNCFVFYIFLYICRLSLLRLNLIKSSFKLPDGFKVAAASGFCIHTWTVGLLLEASLFVVKTAIFLTTGALFVTGSLVVVTPVFFLATHVHSFNDIPDIFYYSFYRKLSQMKWLEYYNLLDQTLRPYFTAPKSFYSDCRICHPKVYEDYYLLEPKLIIGNGVENVSAPTQEVVDDKIPKKDDPWWWVAFTVTVGAAGCVIATWLSR